MAEDLCRAADEEENDEVELRQLTEGGQDVAEEDCNGCTPLQIDAEECQDGVARVLQVAGVAQAAPAPSELFLCSAEVRPSTLTLSLSRTPNPEPQSSGSAGPSNPARDLEAGVRVRNWVRAAQHVQGIGARKVEVTLTLACLDRRSRSLTWERSRYPRETRPRTTSRPGISCGPSYLCRRSSRE